MIPYVASHVDVPVQRVIDPTLLLTSNEYDKIADERLENERLMQRSLQQKMAGRSLKLVCAQKMLKKLIAECSMRQGLKSFCPLRNMQNVL